MAKAYETSIEAWVRKALVEAKDKGKRLEEAIEGRAGLFVAVEPTGKTFWLGRYQLGKGANRVRKRTSLGRYGQGGLTLADATEALAALTSAAAKGVDSLTEQKTKAKSDGLTLRKMFEERKAKDGGTAARTLQDYEDALSRFVFPSTIGKGNRAFGDTPASEITSQEFASLLMEMEDASKHRAHKIRSALGSTYSWAQRRRLVIDNPLKGLAFTHQSERRKRVLTDDELGRLWNASQNFEGVYGATRFIIQLAMLTGQRNSEVAGMEVAELKGLDTATPRWDIPARRMKRKTDDQYVPLSKQAARIVQEALEGADKTHVFPGTTHGRRHERDWQSLYISQDTVSHAFGRVSKSAKVKNIRLHDMRKCITSWLAEHGHATPEVLDAILHHGRKGVTGTHYNFALYEGQVRKALQLWADHVEAVAKAVTAKASNVSKLRA